MPECLPGFTSAQIGVIKSKKRGTHKQAEMTANDILLERRIRSLSAHELYQPRDVEDTVAGRQYRRDTYGPGPAGANDMGRRMLGKSSQLRLHDVDTADIKEALVKLLQGNDLAKGSWPQDAIGQWSSESVARADMYMYSYASLSGCKKPRLEAAIKAVNSTDNSWFSVSMLRSEECRQGLQEPPVRIPEEENKSCTEFPRNLAHLTKDYNDITLLCQVGIPSFHSIIPFHPI